MDRHVPGKFTYVFRSRAGCVLAARPRSYNCLPTIRMHGCSACCKVSCCSLSASHDGQTQYNHVLHFACVDSGDKYLMFGSDPNSLKRDFFKFFSEEDWIADQKLQVIMQLQVTGE